MNIKELRRVIGEHRAEMESIASLRPTPIDAFDKYETLRQKVITCTRQLRTALGRSVVMPIKNWPIKWTQSDIDIRLFSGQWGTAWLAFDCLVDPAGSRRAYLCEFTYTCATQFTNVDYDFLDDHPFTKAGLDGLGAYQVDNSRWITLMRSEHVKENSTHFLFFFYSCFIEIISHEYKIIAENESMDKILDLIPRERPESNCRPRL